MNSAGLTWRRDQRVGEAGRDAGGLPPAGKAVVCVVEVAKGVLAIRADSTDERFEVVRWPVNRAGEPGHIPEANARRLMDKAVAFLSFYADGRFAIAYTAGRGSLTREDLTREVARLTGRQLR